MFFPESIMPGVQKKNSNPVVGDISADDFNKHTNELIAIEQFIGLGEASSADLANLIGGKPDVKNLASILKKLIGIANAFVDGGVAATSGYALSGQRMIFPENVHASFLTSAPATTDNVIHVVSTDGFPDSGVISILNDQDIPTATTLSDRTTVEAISYSSKTATSFQNCQRGVNSTTVGLHVGLTSTTIGVSGLNAPDQCINTSTGLLICNRRYPGWRYKTEYFIAALGLQGTLVEVVRSIRRAPGSFSLTQQVLRSTFSNVINAATQAGILGSAPDGSQILQSADLSQRSKNQLTWPEALAFFNELQSLGSVQTVSVPSDLNVGGSPFVPVFQGRMQVQHSIAAATLTPVGIAGGQAPSQFSTLGVAQSADGRLFVRITSDQSQNLLDQAVIAYKTFFVPSFSSEESL